MVHGATAGSTQTRDRPAGRNDDSLSTLSLSMYCIKNKRSKSFFYSDAIE